MSFQNMQEDKQKLIDLCFELVLTISSPDQAKRFSTLSNDKKADWVAKQLRAAGFDTTPVGSSWGVLVESPEKHKIYDRMNLEGGLYSDVLCPKCGRKHFSIGASVSTAAYSPIIVNEDGTITHHDVNTSTTYCHCYECGCNFRIVNGEVKLDD